MKIHHQEIYDHLVSNGTANTPTLRAIFGRGVTDKSFLARLQYMSRQGVIRNAGAQNETGRWSAVEATPPAGRPLPARRYEVMRAPMLVAPVMCAARGVSA